MSNMSYCEFQNTLEDLRQCRENLFKNTDSSKAEENARILLVIECMKIVELCNSDLENYQEINFNKIKCLKEKLSVFFKEEQDEKE